MTGTLDSDTEAFTRAADESGEASVSGRLTPLELHYLRCRAEGMDLDSITEHLGSNARATMVRVHRKLNVNTTIDALRTVGWLRVPELEAEACPAGRVRT